jgi:RimJ/RimL family protein N-acetyltransferase
VGRAARLRTIVSSQLSSLTIDRADASAIPFVMTTERTQGFDQFVGRWDEARHRAAFADGRHVYFIGHAGGEPVGFVIVRDWAAPERVTLIKRIAVCRPGQGHGRALLTLVVDAIFKQTNAWRVWLGVFPENLRARRAYAAVGFKPEGVARGSAFFYGVHRDELVMAVLRPEWEARG